MISSTYTDMVPVEKLHVLIVEGDSLDLLLVKKLINERIADSVMYHAASFEQAQHLLLKPLHFNVILLNLMDANASMELAKEIVRLAGTVPVIALANYADKELAVNTLSYGISDYLLKDEMTAAELHKSITYSIERRRINLKLVESEDKYRRLFNFSPLPQWVFNTRTLEFLDVNEAAIRHYGYSREEFLSMNIRNIRPAEDVESFLEVLNSSIQKGSFMSSIVRHVKKSGELIYVNVEGNSISFEGKDARLALAVDITEKIQAEKALNISEKRFKALVQEGSDLIGILDLDGNYLYVSPTSLPILGIPPEELIGKNAFDFIFEEDREWVLNQFSKLTHHKRIQISPFRFIDSDNRHRWIETVVTNLTDDPSVGGIVANSRDVTVRIENEKRIKETVERYNAVSKATSDTIYEWDFSTDSVLWNQGMYEVFGHQVTKSSFLWWYEHLHPDDAQRTAQQVRLYIQNRESRWQGEYRFLCKDGSYKFVMDRSFLVYNGSGYPIRMIGSIQDITERKKYIQAIEDQNKRLREIAWIQSHIVRAPVARIMGLIDILKNHMLDKKNQEELLQHLLTSAEELDEVIKSILARTEEFNNQQKGQDGPHPD